MSPKMISYFCGEAIQAGENGWTEAAVSHISHLGNIFNYDYMTSTPLFGVKYKHPELPNANMLVQALLDDYRVRHLHSNATEPQKPCHTD